MSVRTRLRALTRRAVLTGAAARMNVTGQTAQARERPGLSILLMHNTPPPTLPRLAAFIAAHRHRLVDFDPAVRAATDGSAQDAPSPIALSFDDGFRSNFLAARMLADEGISACFYVPTDVIGADLATVDTFFGRPQAEGVFDRHDLELLTEMGHVVGSHSRQHKSLAAMTSAAAEDQIKGSVEVLRQLLGTAGHYAWPFGALSYAPVADVVRWSTEADVVPASGVRGRNTGEQFAAEGYLRRDAVDVRWIGTDTAVFTTRSARK